MTPNIQIIYEKEDVIDLNRTLNIVHFNDVYNIEQSDQEPVGGAARFLTALENIILKGPTLVLFSGDALSPSSISMLVEGRQMIEILNKFHIDCACLGNHDFDFGLDVLMTHIENSNFPWLISNAFDAYTKKPLANVKDKHIIEKDGLKVGLIGLNCDIVIALTHMRWVNDTILAENVPEIDLFLGGHDHDYVVKQINEKWIIKSGTDFRELSVIELDLSEKFRGVNKIEKYIIDSKIEENLEIKSIIDSYLENVNKELDQTLGQMNVELEGRFSYVRTQETNLGNFITDIMLEAVNAECAFLNSGALRSDLVHPIGEFKMRDLKKILPYLDENVVISVTGNQLLQALENGVSKYPKHEGRFLQVSGIRFAFDPLKPPGNRIDPRLVKVQDEILDLEKKYNLATIFYLKQGKEGFDCLIDCPVLIDEENIPVLCTLVENHFKTVNCLKKNPALKKFRSSIVPLVVVNRLMQKINQEHSTALAPTQKLSFSGDTMIVTKVLSRLERQISRETEDYKKKISEFEKESIKLAPKVEGRIIRIQSTEHFEQLLDEFGAIY
ncbi:trifunctional nucleotide phosphoesterase -like [Brachionus plicatilis]|uniref:Trifunctional nucleotide phosphoesterase-like n=1 Tax=Brachionus plicatilis TaxID=10195 RepID=A0A3M7S485_BRAPC|nr:trifunctional nucleotide phosphoesterase -like [Brachionus plicatilis]